MLDQIVRVAGDRDKRQVSIYLRVIEAVAHDEMVRYGEADVSRLDLYLVALGFVEQRGYLN
jgi:hypothetical protein